MNKTINVCAALLLALTLTGCSGKIVQNTVERVSSLNDTPEETAAKAKAKAEKKAAEEKEAEEERARQATWDRYVYAYSVRECGEHVGSPSMYQYGDKLAKEASKDAWWDVEKEGVPVRYPLCAGTYNSLVAQGKISGEENLSR